MPPFAGTANEGKHLETGLDRDDEILELLAVRAHLHGANRHRARDKNIIHDIFMDDILQQAPGSVFF